MSVVWWPAAVLAAPVWRRRVVDGGVGSRLPLAGSGRALVIAPSNDGRGHRTTTSRRRQGPSLARRSSGKGGAPVERSAVSPQAEPSVAVARRTGRTPTYADGDESGAAAASRTTTTGQGA